MNSGSHVGCPCQISVEQKAFGSKKDRHWQRAPVPASGWSRFPLALGFVALTRIVPAAQPVAQV